jgi:glutathione S-transferase
MKLWSGVLSPFSAKVRVALAEKGLEVEILEVPWSRKTRWGPKPPEFLAVSPLGQVPVLIDGDLTLYDSTVINEYLEDRSPSPALLPSDATERARARQLEDRADDAIDRYVTVLVQEVFLKPDEADRDSETLANAVASLRKLYTHLELELAGREYLAGGFGLADIACFMALGFAATLGVAPAEDQPRVTAWFERVRSRPTVATEFEGMTKAAATA